ncbi:helix-turn-helix transcriptional regulator [Paucibacter sp. Y2R2-4]|uniref:helix-turn-helix transcriptional regulator n=1 Tax=Paucibacter sp. Y2R2-4 TaxID=2893553 RepID=UPI0021E4B545|nr:AlpA family transcriptional regulator [Paucibacter sp. Y2R2-4]MCV2348711.1 AlpA family transcriptional regulator [Paucibacter sp. Y2R2-4]
MQLVSENRPQIKRDRLLRLPDVETASGMKKSTIYLLMKRGQFPRCVQVTPRCVAWPESAVLQWVQDRIASVSGVNAQSGGNASVLGVSGGEGAQQ